MSFEWRHFLELAETLADGAKGAQEEGTDAAMQEAALRTSVSRAYYAAYHTVRSYVSAVGRGEPPKGDSHTWVWSQLDPKKRRQEGQLRRDGFAMLKNRKAADYDLDSSTRDRQLANKPRKWNEEAAYAVETARRVLKLIDDIRPKE